MIEFQQSGVFLRADSIEATFPNGVSKSLTPTEVLLDRPLGDEIVFRNKDESNATDDDYGDYTVRFYLIDPHRDWRQNAEYAWKLDSAWMSVPSTNGDLPADRRSTKGVQRYWLHWNVNSFVDSAIKSPSNEAAVACGHLELHFNPIGHGRATRLDPRVPPSKIVLSNVNLGAGSNKTSQLINACTGDLTDAGSCTVIDGMVASRMMQMRYRTPWEFVGILVGTAILAIAVALWNRMIKNFEKEEKRYASLARDEEAASNQDESSEQSEASEEAEEFAQSDSDSDSDTEQE